MVRRRRLALVRIFLVLGAFAALEAGWRAARFLAALKGGRRPAGLVEVYVVGESTAVGSPYDVSLGAWVKAALGDAPAARPIEVVMVAEGGATIHPQRASFARALARRRRSNPGVVLIYTGHNDAFNFRFETSFFEYVREAVLEKSAVLADLLLLAERRELLRRERTTHTYERHLRGVVEASLEVGLTPILAVPASNLADVDPYVPLHWFSEGPVEARRVLARGEALEAGGRWDRARSLYREASDRDRRLAPYLRYRLGRCAQRQGRLVAARALYQACIDQRAFFGMTDTFGRATGVHAGIVRRLAAEYALPLVDTPALFAAASPRGLPGDDLFIDAHHPNLRGYALLGSAFAAATAKVLGVPAPRPFTDSQERLAELGLGVERRLAAEASTGFWYLGAVRGQAFRSHRLRAAERRFRAGLSGGERLGARLGLALVELGERGDAQAAELERLALEHPRMHDRRELPQEVWEKILARLRAAGVSSESLRRADAAYRLGV